MVDLCPVVAYVVVWDVAVAKISSEPIIGHLANHVWHVIEANTAILFGKNDVCKFDGTRVMDDWILGLRTYTHSID